MCDALGPPRASLPPCTSSHRLPFGRRRACAWRAAPRAAQDDDPYVRKTAAVCVAKLYDINPELVEDRGFLDALKARRAAAPPRTGRLARA